MNETEIGNTSGDNGVEEADYNEYEGQELENKEEKMKGRKEKIRVGDVKGREWKEDIVVKRTRMTRTR